MSEHTEAVIHATPDPCPAWGYFEADAEVAHLRRLGIKVAGQCRLPSGHDGEHSLVLHVLDRRQP